MKKIVYIVSSLRKSGPIIVLQNILRNIDSSRYVYEIIKLIDDEPSRSITHEFIAMGATVHELHLTKLQIELFPAKVAGQIEHLLAKVKPDIIHAHGYQSVIVTSKLKTRVPKIETLHCISKEDYTMGRGMLMGLYMNCRYLLAQRHLDGAAAISHAVKDYYLKIRPNANIKCIFNGIHLPETGWGRGKAELRNNLKLATDDIIFVVIASLSKRKDPLTIIKAFQTAFPTNTATNVKLIFLGKGVLHDKCKSVIGNDQRITLAGWKPNVYDYLAASDYSISASHSEGFGLSFVESLAFGTPIIATDIAAFNDFFSLYPNLKRYRFEVGNIDMLVDILRKAVSESIDISNITKDVLTRFSDKTMSNNYMDFYDEITGSYIC